MALSQYGDGIRHLLMMAIKAAMNPGGIFLIEEPETHLHPHHQRHLLSFLADKVGCQICITSHSPIFLDSKKADRIFHVSKESVSIVTDAGLPRALYSVLEDIGARPSDILQANVVIWVEGPSDRILIRHALGILDPNPHEGLQYQIVSYGGALRKYCTFGDGAGELVDLMKLGRSVVMVCDRDGNSLSGKIDKEKSRLNW